MQMSARPPAAGRPRQHRGDRGRQGTELERVKGIEPSSKAWEAFVLPLNYTRNAEILRQPVATRRRPHPTPKAMLRASMSIIDSIAQSEVIALIINGQARTFAAPLNVTSLVRQLDLQGKRIALERNGEIVPRSDFPDLELQDGDALEIVVAVGGG